MNVPVLFPLGTSPSASSDPVACAVELRPKFIYLQYQHTAINHTISYQGRGRGGAPTGPRRQGSGVTRQRRHGLRPQGTGIQRTATQVSSGLHRTYSRVTLRTVVDRWTRHRTLRSDTCDAQHIRSHRPPHIGVGRGDASCSLHTPRDLIEEIRSRRITSIIIRTRHRETPGVGASSGGHAHGRC